MNAYSQGPAGTAGVTEATRIYPTQVDSSVSSNVKCMLHQSLDEGGERQLVISMEPGDYWLSYTDEFRSVFKAMRVLSGTAAVESNAGRISGRAGEVQSLSEDREMLVSVSRFTQVLLFEAYLTGEPEANEPPDADRNREWIMARPRPKGPTPPSRAMMVNIVPGQD